MCVEPCNLPDGEQVACRYCWQCRANRVNDLVGRCIAEQTTSAAVYAVTLTYAGTGPETAMLRYRDIQLMLKLIRRKGYACRYIVAGEFGTKKGRAHWHAVLFFSCVGPLGPMPIPRIGNGPWDIQIGRNINWKPWPHGYVFFQQPDYGGFAYVLKYALKDQDADVAKGHLAMSKKPPLGHAYFMARAEQQVAQGLAPQDLFYSFGNVFDAKRQRRQFLIQGTTRQNFINHFCDIWRAVHGTEPPLSDALTDHWDKLARQEAARAETDQHAFAVKSQWPRYVPTTEADIRLYEAEGVKTRRNRHGRKVLEVPESAALKPLAVAGFDAPDRADEVHAPWPVALWDITPSDALEVVGNGDPIDIRLEWRAGPLPLTINIDKEQIGWLVNEEDAQRVREWLHQVQPESLDPLLW